VYRVLFDTNAPSKLVNGSALSREVQRRLRCEVRHRRAQVIVSEPVLMEEAKSGDRAPALYMRELRELRFLCAGRVLLPFHLRLVHEVRARGLGPDRDVFLSRAAGERIFTKLHAEHPKRKEHADALRARLPKFKEEELKVRAEEERLLNLDPDRRKVWKAELAEKGIASIIDEQVLDFMATNADALGLSNDRAFWPSPREVPSLRAHAAYYVAWADRVHADGRALKANDYVDQYVYADAVHADVLVTDDGDFREIGELAQTGILMVTFEHWATDFLGRFRP
jgi:hypothetical protein